METVNSIELGDESVYPDDAILRGVLGRSYRACCALLELFEQLGMVHEWRYYRDGKAWLCKVQKKKRTIIWMSAWKGFMKATIYVPERLMNGVYALPISETLKEQIRATKNVGKSKPCIFEIRNQKILRDLRTVAKFKIQAR